MIGQYPDDELRRKRIRRVKRLLKPMPRKTNLHKYPILKYFASYARKRTYLWEFKEEYVTKAIFIGWFIALIPMYGLQMIAAFILCMLLRGNALIAMLLQWITNPITVIPIFYLQFNIGDYFYTDILNLDANTQIDVLGKIEQEGFESFFVSLKEWSMIKYVSFSMAIGGFIIALIGSIINNILYKIYLSRFKKKHR